MNRRSIYDNEFDDALTVSPKKRSSVVLRDWYVQFIAQYFYILFALENRHTYINYNSNLSRCEISQPLHVGILIVLKEDNIPLTSWRLRYITQLRVCLGVNGYVRVVIIKTENGELKWLLKEFVCFLSRVICERTLKDYGPAKRAACCILLKILCCNQYGSILGTYLILFVHLLTMSNMRWL